MVELVNKYGCMISIFVLIIAHYCKMLVSVTLSAKKQSYISSE